jgi:hypothetical protein
LFHNTTTQHNVTQHDTAQQYRTRYNTCRRYKFARLGQISRPIWKPIWQQCIRPAQSGNAASVHQ